MSKDASLRLRGRILVVDDEPSIRSGLSKLLTSAGYAVETAEDGAVALARVAERPPDVVVTDLAMPNVDGMELLAGLRKTHRDLPVIVATASGDLATAVAAMRQGAEDYVTKPIDLDALLVTLERALDRRELQVEADNLRRHFRDREGDGLKGLMGVSPAMQKVYRLARQVAPARATVLITGESGTGKGELAHAIHQLSPRAEAPFVALPCSALAESLLESELFGHERGSFTGADRRRVGRFEQAHGGTLFLDEVGEMTASTQVKLLHVLQERTFERVGGNETIATDVRLLAATHRDLESAVREGRFREDLYYRLNVVHIEMPPLRLRGADRLILADYFLRRFALENHKRIDGFSDGARAKILAHRWPGNVRELENAVERAVVMAEGAQVRAEDLPASSGSFSLGAVRVPGATMAEIEKHAILATLEATEGSTARAAEMLDISVRTIQYRLHEYGAGATGPKERC